MKDYNSSSYYRDPSLLKKGFYIHLIVYILVNLLLIYINYTYTPTKIWFIYPLLGWGIGVAVHFICTIYFKGNKG